ncbi:MAG: hypothetical protein K0M73_22160, partial [Hydrogenophaga sp.]|nr:hypothetical protein [Hydrogenophaga sp.]
CPTRKSGQIEGGLSRIAKALPERFNKAVCLAPDGVDGALVVVVASIHPSYGDCFKHGFTDSN